MSNDMTGADLEQLDALATACSRTGAAVAARAADLHARIEHAVSTFTSTMSRLQQQSVTLTRAIDDEVGTVTAQAGATAWTGGNRGAFDGDLQRFDAQVHAASAAIDAGVTELRGSVDARFTPVLESFGVSVAAAGDGVEATTGELGGSVSRQRAALEQAADVGWTSA